MDEFLDDYEVTMLTRDLRDIAVWLPELGRIARRETSPPGGRAARNPVVPSSRPPMNIAAFNLADDVATTLWVWCLSLTKETGAELPARHPSDCARHLALHADRVAGLVWGRTCHDRVRGRDETDSKPKVPSMWRQVRHMVEPPAPSTAEDRGITGLAVKAYSDQAFGSAGDMVVVHFAVTGQSLSESTIRSWRRKGKLPDRYGPGSEPWYWYPEVARVAAAAPPRSGGVKTRPAKA